MGGIFIELQQYLQLTAPWVWGVACLLFLVFIGMWAVFRGTVRDLMLQFSLLLLMTSVWHLSFALWFYAVSDTRLPWFGVFPLVEAGLAYFILYPALNRRRTEPNAPWPLVQAIGYWAFILAIVAYVSFIYSEKLARLRHRDLDFVQWPILTGLLLFFSYLIGWSTYVFIEAWRHAYHRWHEGETPAHATRRAIAGQRQVAELRKKLEDGIAENHRPQELAPLLKAIQRQSVDVQDAYSRAKSEAAKKAASQAAMDCAEAEDKYTTHLYGVLPTPGDERDLAEKETLRAKALADKPLKTLQKLAAENAIDSLMDDRYAEQLRRKAEDNLGSIASAKERAATFAQLARTHVADQAVVSCEHTLAEGLKCRENIEDDIKTAAAERERNREAALSTILGEAFAKRSNLDPQVEQGILAQLHEHAGRLTPDKLRTLMDATTDLRDKWVQIDGTTVYYPPVEDDVVKKLSETRTFSDGELETLLQELREICRNVCSRFEGGTTIERQQMHDLVLKEYLLGQ